MRKDVLHLAERLDATADLGVDSIYAFLMWVGRDRNCNPCKLAFTARPGRVSLQADEDSTYLEEAPKQATQRLQTPYNEAEADHYENLILARQEAFMDL